MIIIIICGENKMTTDTVVESKVNEEQNKIIYSGTYTITNSKGEHRTFRIKRQKKDAKFAPGARILSLMVGPDNSGHQYAVMLSKRCVRCNRKLTNPESIKAGIGPECATKDF